MNYKNERNLTKIIRYSLPLLTIIISLVITILLFLEKKRSFQEEKNLLNTKLIKENKKNIQEKVEKVYNYILYMKKSTENSLKEEIKNRVYEGYQIADDIYKKYKDKKSKEEIFKIIKDTLRSITFNKGRGYFFIDDINGEKHLQPLNPEFEGQNLLNFKDAKGYEFVKTIVETIKNKSERFDTYYWYKPNGLEAYRKISFYKYFEPFNVVIGTGEYVEDFESEVKTEVLNYINKNAGYIFILDYDFNYLSHMNPSYIGKNALFVNDAKNIETVLKDILYIAQNSEGYYSYFQLKKPDTNLPSNKISYIKGVSNWNWIIGTEFYEDDLKNNLKQKKKEIDNKFSNYISNVLIVALILTLIFLAISIYISKLIEENFRVYKKEIENQQNILAQQSKMASMGEMIANIAHQWRQPLSIISTAATGISFQKELNTLTDKDFFEATEKINDSAQYLSKTIDDFKNFFSPIKNEKETNIKDLILKTFKLLDAQFKTKNINIVQNIQDIKIVTLENEFLQVLINILNNARDELVKVEYDRYIFINVFTHKQTAIIEIYDNAGGINENHLEKVFEPYFTTKDKSIGTGIGLYMSHEIVTKHLNGTLSVENYNFTYKNENYKGAKFIIEIFI